MDGITAGSQFFCVGLVQATATMSTHQNRQALAIECGFDPNFDFLGFLANGYIQLLAAGVTDASINSSKSQIEFGCKTAATKAMADLMIDFKRVNKEIMQFSCGNNYDCDAPPKMSCRIQFRGRGTGQGATRRSQSKYDASLNNFSADDLETIYYLEDTAEELDELRKKVQDWYKDNLGCGVTQRYTTTHCNVRYAPKPLVRQMIVETLRDDTLRNLFLGLLDQANPNADDQLRIKSILNGSFFFSTMSYTAFHFCPQLLEFGFPSSHSTACALNRALWDNLIASAVAQGHSRRDVLSMFILVWAAMDGSIFKEYLQVIIPDNAEMIAFFHEIIHELHEGVRYSINEQHAPSEVENGKDIVYLTVSTPRKLCSVLLNVLSNDDKYVPHKKAHQVRQQAAAWNATQG